MEYGIPTGRVRVEKSKKMMVPAGFEPVLGL
jgi:hypothetical protein